LLPNICSYINLTNILGVDADFTSVWVLVGVCFDQSPTEESNINSNFNSNTHSHCGLKRNLSDNVPDSRADIDKYISLSKIARIRHDRYSSHSHLTNILVLPCSMLVYIRSGDCVENVVDRKVCRINRIFSRPGDDLFKRIQQATSYWNRCRERLSRLSDVSHCVTT
jgi:hypothetical protein